MRILIATDAWRPQINGVVRTLEMMVERLPASGCCVSLVTADDFRTTAMPGYPEIRLALASPGEIARRMRHDAVDIVHIATEGPIGWAARRAALQLGLPLTTSYHTRFPEYIRARAPVPLAITYMMLRRFHAASDGVFVSTPSLMDELSQRGFRNLHLWSRGVELDRFRPRTVDLARWPRPVFLSVGRVAVEKNLDAFLSLDLPGTKVVVGDGPQKAELQARYPEVVFLGALTGHALAEAYAQSDVFVFPSRTDTFGIVILEALAAGLPVAAYPVVGPKDIVNARSGVLSTDLQHAAINCLALSSRDCVRRAAEFSWTHAAEQFVRNLEAARILHSATKIAA